MTEEEVYEEEKGGPGGDIYVKGAWVLHTLRNRSATRPSGKSRAGWSMAVRPKPGNFKPRFATTPEYIAIVNQVTGKDMDWFFDVYLRQAALPELIETREGDRLTLRWKTPGQALPASGRGADRRQGRDGGDDRRHRKHSRAGGGACDRRSRVAHPEALRSGRGRAA
jgi:aminopeptidase N